MPLAISYVCLTVVLVVRSCLAIGCTVIPPGRFAVQRNGICYTYTDNMLTCENAINYCTGTKTTLLKLTSPELQLFLVNEVVKESLQRAENARFWISPKDLRGDGDWRWPDGTPVRWKNWRARQNRNSCLHSVGPDGIWIESLNDDLFLDGTYCEAEISTTTTTTTTTTTKLTTTTTPTTATSLATTTSPTITTGPASTIIPSTPVTTTEDVQDSTAPTTSEPRPITVAKPRRRRKLRPAVRERSAYFAAQFGEDAFLARKDDKTVKAFSVTSCCSKCLPQPTCVLVNFNQSKFQCRLFFGARALQEEVQRVDGWVLMSKVNH